MKNKLQSANHSFKKSRLLIPGMLLLASIIFGGASKLNAQNCSVSAGGVNEVCVTDQLFLTGERSGLLNQPEVITWSQISGPAATIVSPNSLITEVTNILGGATYIFPISTKCLDSSLVFQDVTKQVNDVTLADAGIGFTSCPGINIGQLSANAPGVGETGTWSIIDPNNGVTIVSVNDPNSFVNFSAAACGTTTLRWTITSTSTCRSFDEVVVINRGGVLPFFAGIDQVLHNSYCTTQSTNLNGNYGCCGLGGQQETRTVVSGPNVPNIVNPNNNNTAFNNLIQGTYAFRWTLNGACASGFDEVQIIVPAPH